MGIWIAATLISTIIKGICGMGDAPVFSSILVFANANVDITPVSLLLSLPTNTFLAWRERSGLKKSIWLPMSIMLVAGSIAGTVILKNTDVRVLKNYFGVFIMLIGAYMLMNELRPGKRKPSRFMTTAIGILSGVGSGLFGIGALLGAYMNQVAKDSHEFRANICMIFAVENFSRLISGLVFGIITPVVFRRTLMLYPVMGLGLFIGIRCRRYLSERKTKVLMMTMLILSGAALLITNH